MELRGIARVLDGISAAAAEMPAAIGNGIFRSRGSGGWAGGLFHRVVGWDL